jgi:ribosomal protein L2
MNRLPGTEKPRSWKAMNETTNPLGGGAARTRHREPSTPQRR